VILLNLSLIKTIYNDKHMLDQSLCLHFREEATKVWVRSLQLQSLEEMNKTDPKTLRRTIVIGLLAILGLSGIVHLFVVK